MSGPYALYTAAEMRAADAAAIEKLGVPGAVLMERAGLAAAEEILRHATGRGRAAVVCGAGNNGGDQGLPADLRHPLRPPALPPPADDA